MKYLMGILGVAVLLAGCSDNPNVKWQKCTGHDQTYSIDMPGKATYTNQKAPVPGGQIDIHIYELITKQVNYTFGCSLYPPGFLSTMGNTPNAIFASAQNATVQKLNATVLDQQNSTFKNYPKHSVTMKAYVAESKATMIIRQDLYLVKGKMYMVQSLVFEPKADAYKEVIDQYHQSFELTL